MANITIWYKTSAGQSLGSVPASQKILFDTDKKVVHLYQWSPFGTNIKKTQSPNREGTRISNVEDAGFDGIDMMIIGYVMADQTQEVSNLFSFMKILQTPDALPFGRFCIDNPNGPAMTIEANATKGLSIRTPQVKWNQTAKSYDFTFPMIFGGTFV